MKHELKMSKEVQATLSGLYNSFRSNKQRRKTFLESLLRLFSDNQKEVIFFFFLVDLYKYKNLAIKH